jgi:hypothetical protein
VPVVPQGSRFLLARDRPDTRAPIRNGPEPRARVR